MVFTDFLIPASVLIYCYCRIIWVLRKRATSKMEATTSASGSEKFKMAERNIIRTLLVVVLFFFLCIGYANIFYLFYTFGYEIDWNSGYYTFSVVMVFLSCTVNPFIYLFNYKDFQRGLKNLFCCIKQNKNENLQSHTVDTIA